MLAFEMRKVYIHVDLTLSVMQPHRKSSLNCFMGLFAPFARLVRLVDVAGKLRQPYCINGGAGM